VTRRHIYTIGIVRVYIYGGAHARGIWTPYNDDRPSKPLKVVSMFLEYIWLGTYSHCHLLEYVLQQFGYEQMLF